LYLPNCDRDGGDISRVRSGGVVSKVFVCKVGRDVADMVL